MTKKKSEQPAEGEVAGQDTGGLLDSIRDKAGGGGRPPRKRGGPFGFLQGPGKLRPVPKAGGYQYAGLMTQAWDALGSWVTSKLDPGVGQAMRFTAPVAGKVLNRGVRKIPLFYWLLAPLATEGGVQDAGAMFGIPWYVGVMERDPTLIPQVLPKVKYLAKPAIRELVRAAEKESEDAAELAELQVRYAAVAGVEHATLDHLILVSLMGMPVDLADEILSAKNPAEIVGAFTSRGLAPPAPRAVRPTPPPAPAEDQGEAEGVPVEGAA